MQGRCLGGGSGGYHAAAIPTIPPSAVVCLIGSQPSPPVEGGWGCTHCHTVEDGVPPALLLWSSHCCILIGALIIIRAVGASPCCHHHPWCPALLLASPLVHGGLMWWWVPPCSSLWLCGPPGHHCGVGAHRGCLLLVIEAMGDPRTHHHGHVVPPWWLSWLGPPIIIVAIGAPTRPHGHVVPPLVVLVVMWCPLVVIMAIPSCPHGRGPPLVLVVVWCSGHRRHRGYPLVVLVAMWCRPLIFMVMWTPPGCCHGRVVPRGHWCPPPLVLIAVGALEAVGVPPLIPWCPARPLVLPGHCGGCVMAMWCPPARPRGRVVPWPSSWVPPWLSLWLCGARSFSWLCGPPLVVVVAIDKHAPTLHVYFRNFIRIFWYF